MAERSYAVAAADINCLLDDQLSNLAMALRLARVVGLTMHPLARAEVIDLMFQAWRQAQGRAA